MKKSANNSTCRIVLDAMGGDFAPRNEVLGAIAALSEDSSIEILLVGKKDLIISTLNEHNLSFPEQNIYDAEDVITMSDSPTAALRTKPNSSLVVSANLVRSGKGDALVSAGNTGAVMAASTLLLGRLKGVGRPTIGVPMPSETGTCFLFDAGASVDCKPSHLLEYAIMSKIYVQEIYNVKNPSIGLLSVGEEKSKGNDLTLKAYELLDNVRDEINFKGNVEGKDILGGKTNIVICDGFTGNVILKFAESVVGILKQRIKSFALKSFFNKIKVLFMRGTLKKVLSDFSSEKQGGVPLLGVKAVSIIGHGSGSPTAIKNMILKAKEMHEKQLLHKIEKALSDYANK